MNYKLYYTKINIKLKKYKKKSYIKCRIKHNFNLFYFLFYNKLNIKFFKNYILLKKNLKNKKNFLIYKSYFSLLKNFFFGFFFGFSKIINIIGRGYFLKKNNILIILSIGLSHKKYFIIPKNIFIKKITKTKFYIYGINFYEFKQILKIFQNLQKPWIYKKKGFFFEKEIISLKKGKKSIK